MIDLNVIARYFVQNLPELSKKQAEWLVNPANKAKLIFDLSKPVLSGVLPHLSKKIQLIALHSAWDFVILQSKDYPEIGIAASELSESLGHGLKLVFQLKGGRIRERFVCPCGCCGWNYQLEIFGEFPFDLIHNTCKANGIKILVIHCADNLRQSYRSNEESGLKFLEPYLDGKDWHIAAEQGMLDISRFCEAFSEIMVETGDKTFSFGELIANK